MASKTSSNPKSQEQSMKTAVQSQLARIKKEEEEELWISGEELYTEGSSDEEEYKTQSRSRRKINNNQSPRTFPVNPTIEQRDHSPISGETEARSGQSVNVSKDSINENKSIPKNVSKDHTITFENLSRSPSMESSRTDCLSTVRSSVSLITKDSSDFLTEEEQIENTEISWKAKRELCNNEELFEDEWNDETDISNIDTKDECIQKEILEVQNLDTLMRAMNDKVKKAIEETLFYQCENRKRLEKIVTSRPTETGKLAENTLQFFYLCPKFTTLNAEFHKNNGSHISFKENDYKQCTLQSEDYVNLLNLDNEDELKLSNSTSCVENMNDTTQDFDSNPYIVNSEIKEILKEVEKKKNLHNEEVQPLEECDSMFNTNSIVSALNSTSTVTSLQDIDNDLIDEVIEKAQVMDPSSIVNVAED